MFKLTNTGEKFDTKEEAMNRVLSLVDEGVWCPGRGEDDAIVEDLATGKKWILTEDENDPDSPFNLVWRKM